ncbi:MAG: hypothetical protein WA749_01465 [Gelidibacter sp.]
MIIEGLSSTLLFAPLLIPPLYWWVNKPAEVENEVDNKIEGQCFYKDLSAFKNLKGPNNLNNVPQ